MIWHGHWPFFGMVLVNFETVMTMGRSEADSGWLRGFVGLFEGRAAATFVVLAGIGISLLSQHGRIENDRARQVRDRRTLLKRALFLFVVGLTYSAVWPPDILYFYCLYIAIAAFLLTTPTVRLLMYAGALVLGFFVLVFVLDYEQGWDWETLTYTEFGRLMG